MDYVDWTSNVVLQVMAYSLIITTVLVIVGIFKPTKVVVALVRLSFILGLVIIIGTIIWGLSTMLFLYLSGGGFK